MRKYKATPGALIIGSAMRNFFVSLNQDDFITIVEKKLTKAGIAQLDNDEWYPHQISLDIFNEIAQNVNATQNLVALGMAYVKTATFPPEADTIEKALMLLHQVYQLNVKNISEREGYEIQRVSNDHIRVIDLNPFPHDTVYGFIWGIANRFKEVNTHPTVVRTYKNEADPDSDGAVYDITWE